MHNARYFIGSGRGGSLLHALVACNPQAMADALRKELLAQLKVLNKLDSADLLARRYERLMSYGVA